MHTHLVNKLRYQIMSSHDLRRSRQVAVPSHKTLEDDTPNEMCMWHCISDTTKSNTEDLTEIRTLIAKIRKTYSDLAELDDLADELQKACKLIVDELRRNLVELLSSRSECSSMTSRRSRRTQEWLNDQSTHASSREQN